MNQAVLVFILIVGLTSYTSAQPTEARYKIQESWEIGKVPADFPVRFSLLTHNDRQYVAYYNELREMTIASRVLDSDEWEYRTLPTKIGWDTHNYVTMIIDNAGQLHVSGNMHGDPLIYFRTTEAENILSLKQFKMTGKLENRVTYPVFLKDHEGELIFSYRHGGSGNGVTIYNKYDSKSEEWSRLTDKFLLDGQGKTNAYPSAPTLGPDGYFHMLWVWRDTPDCATNHHLSYARSRDLIYWESAFGDRAELPMTIEDKSLWVDPIPSGGGIINGGAKLSFDSNDRPIINYHKSDEAGMMQIFVARPEDSIWEKRVLTDWNKPILFSGRGSMGFVGISISKLDRFNAELLTMTYNHRDYGRGRLFIKEDTLKTVEKRYHVPRDYPRSLNPIESSFKGIMKQSARDLSWSEGDSTTYLLQWETLGRNYDRPRKPPLPEPSTLKLYKLISE